MSARELTRVEVLSRVKSGTLSLGSAATLLAVSYRQAKRLARRYRTEGAKGLKHRSAGGTSKSCAAHGGPASVCAGEPPASLPPPPALTSESPGPPATVKTILDSRLLLVLVEEGKVEFEGLPRLQTQLESFQHRCEFLAVH